MLSFLLDNELAESESGGERVVLTSASSKAAIGTAHLLHQRRVETIAATSRRATAFCASSTPTTPSCPTTTWTPSTRGATILIDLAGNPRHASAIAGSLGRHLRRTILAGFTQIDQSADIAIGDVFSAPARIVELTKRWGREEFDERVANALADFSRAAAGWLSVQHASGPDAVAAALTDVRDGRVPPDRAIVATLAPGLEPATSVDRDPRQQRARTR